MLLCWEAEVRDAKADVRLKPSACHKQTVVVAAVEQTFPCCCLALCPEHAFIRSLHGRWVSASVSVQNTSVQHTSPFVNSQRSNKGIKRTRSELHLCVRAYARLWGKRMPN